MAEIEAQHRNVESRLNLVLGDSVTLVDRLSSADVVVLDRVVCCYPDYPALLRSALSRLSRFPCAVVPSRSVVRASHDLGENLMRRVKRDDFRAFVHPAARLETILTDAGFKRLHRGRTWVWCADVYSRGRAA